MGNRRRILNMKARLFLITILLSILNFAQVKPSKFNGGIELPNATEKSLPEIKGFPTFDSNNVIDGWIDKDFFKIDLESISELESYTGSQSVALVKDSLRGGVFYKSNEALTADNGTVFSASGGGFWVRDYNIENGLNVLWYGADNTGVSDNADVLEDVILNHSVKTGKVFIPKGNYKITKTIGSIVSSNYNERLTHHLEIIAEKGALIYVDDTVTPEISSVIGIDVANINLTIKNLSVDGGNVTNRGIYIRHQSGTSFAHFTAENMAVRNINIGFNRVEGSGRGFNIYGAFDKVRINNCTVDEIKATDTSRPVAGIVAVSGYDVPTSTTWQQKSVEITNNNVRNVYKVGVPNKTDQDGISVGLGSWLTDEEHQTIISGNRIINSGGRFIKTQGYNIKIENNFMKIEEGFNLSPDIWNYGIDAQHSDVTIRDNEFVYENLVGANHIAPINISERFNDLTFKRLIVSGNKVLGKDLSFFARISEDTTAKNEANIVFQDNLINVGLGSFLNFSPTATDNFQRRFVFISNSVKSLTNQWFLNVDSKNTDLLFIGNSNRGTARNSSNFTTSQTLIENLGFIEPDTYTAQGISALDFTGTVTKTLTLTKGDGTTISGTFTDLGGTVITTSDLETGTSTVVRGVNALNLRTFLDSRYSTITSLNLKANDSDVAKLTGNQTISGNKTFSNNIIISSDPTANTHATNKGYVDAQGWKNGITVYTLLTNAEWTASGVSSVNIDLNYAIFPEIWENSYGCEIWWDSDATATSSKTNLAQATLLENIEIVEVRRTSGGGVSITLSKKDTDPFTIPAGAKVILKKLP